MEKLLPLARACKESICLCPLPFSLCLFLPEASHVDHEPIFDVTLQHPLVSFVDVLHRDHLDLARDSAARTEIEHLVRLGDSPDQRPGIPAVSNPRSASLRIRSSSREGIQSLEPTSIGS